MEKKELKFIHISKCAGTFIEKIGLSNGYKWGKNHKEYGFWHENFSTKSDEFKNKYDWFMVVRNPYDRILSEYYCKWGGIGEKNVNHNKEEFNNYLIHAIINRTNDGHYTEQYKYYDDKSKINIIKFENLNIELTELFNIYKININISTKKINTKEKRNKDIIKFFTIDDFNPTLIELINKTYANDFELFNYEIKKNINGVN